MKVNNQTLSRKRWSRKLSAEQLENRLLLTAGLVSQWTGDTDASDSQGTNDGVLVGGAVAGVSGIVAGAFSLDGVDDRVEVPYDTSLNLSSAFTVSAWVNFSSLNKLQGIVCTGLGGELHQYCLSTGEQPALYAELQLLVRDATHSDSENRLVTTGANLEANRWYHVAATGDSNLGIKSIYLDAELLASNVAPGPFENTGGPVEIGSANRMHTLHGLLDDIQIYSGALTATEIRSIFYAGMPPNVEPEAVDDNYVVSEDAVLNVDADHGVLANDTDEDMDVLRVTQVISGPANGIVAVATDGSFTYTPNVDFTGLDMFTYEVSDNNGGFATATATINVLSAQQQIDDILGQVETLVAVGSLNQGNGNSLTSKLENAVKKLDQGKTEPGIHQLEASIHQIEAFINVGILDDLGDGLIDQIAKAIVSAG